MITAAFNNMGVLPNQRLRFSLPSIILAEVLGNTSLLQQVQKATSVGCD